MTSLAQTLEAPTRRAESARLMRPAALVVALVGVLLLVIGPASESVSSTASGAAATNFQAVPLAARPLVSRTLGRDQASFAVHRGGSGLVATNREQGLWARFGVQGVQVRAGSDTIGLRVRSLGYGQALRPVEAATPLGKL